jgi:haloacid dehalogenase-like hydrolase
VKPRGWFERSEPCPSLWNGALSLSEAGNWGISVQTMERHRAAGHGLVLVTASLDFYANPFGRWLGFDAVLCTRAAYDAEDRVTRALVGDNCYGLAKLRLVQHYSAAEAAGLPSSAIRITMTNCRCCV